jgi:MFS family permease
VNGGVIQRNVVLLFFAQLIFVSGSVLVVTIGGIVGSETAPDPGLATLPIALMVVGTALTTVPAALLMQRIGRRAGFCIAALIACAGALLAAWALRSGDFWLFCLATSLIGSTLAFSQQFRFAAAESVSQERVNYAVSTILLGSIGGAYLGPELVGRSPGILAGHAFEAALMATAVLYVAAAVLLLGVRDVIVQSRGEDRPARSLKSVVAQPLFVLAVSAGVVGQGVMTFVMTATPVSMHVVDGHDLGMTAGVVRAHVIAMYLPSLVSAPLIGRFGAQNLMVAGVLAMLAAVVSGVSGQAVMHYWLAMVLLGVGWNFLYLGGTSLLVTTYRASERFRAQAVNEFSVFGVSATASLLAGTVLHAFGWHWVVLSALAPLCLMLLAIAWSRRTQAG